MGTLSTAILTNGRGEFFLDQVALGDPGPGEALVEIHASGVCHTDYDTMRWGRTMVMGREGAGIAPHLRQGSHSRPVRRPRAVELGHALRSVLPVPSRRRKYLRSQV